MTFLNPLVLLGLVAATVPVILHFLNRRKLRTIEFSSLRFLKELEHSSLRRLKLRQLLLLIVRTMLIIVLVLSFARPALHGPIAGIVGAKAHSSMALLLDDSPSMTVRNDRGMLFTQARQAAEQILALADEGDRVAVVPLSRIRTDSTVLSFEHPAGAASTISRLQPSQISVPYALLFKELRPLLLRSHDANREVYLITDGQATQFAAPIRSTDSLPAFDRAVHFFLVRTPPGNQQNAGIEQIRIESRILSQNRPVQLRLTIRNFGPEMMAQRLISLFLDGIRSVQQLVDLPPQSSRTLEVAVIPKRAGIIPGSVELEDDALETDNTRAFVLKIPAKIFVATCGPSTADLRFPLLALTLRGDSLAGSALTALPITPEQLPFADLGKCDVLLLYGIDRMSHAQGEALSGFVRRGGGLIVFPGRGLEARSYDESLWKPLGIPGWAPPEAGDSLGGIGGFLSFSSADESHPIFSGLFEERRPTGNFSLESPRVRTVAAMRLGNSGEAIITLSNGAPFLSEFRSGEGRVLVFGVDAGTAWSDFPLKGLFVPLLHRSVDYLATPLAVDTAVEVGTALRFALPSSRTDVQRRYAVTSPAGVEERLGAKVIPGRGTVEFLSSPTVETGVYTLHVDPARSSPPLAACAVVPSDAEGDLRPASEDELRRFWGWEGIVPERVRYLRTDDAMNAAVRESRYGVELWKFLAGLAILLALLEMSLGRDRRGKEETP